MKILFIISMIIVLVGALMLGALGNTKRGKKTGLIFFSGGLVILGSIGIAISKLAVFLSFL